MTKDTNAKLIAEAEELVRDAVSIESTLLAADPNPHELEEAQKRLYAYEQAFHKLSMKISLKQTLHEREAGLRNKQ